MAAQVPVVRFMTDDLEFAQIVADELRRHGMSLSRQRPADAIDGFSEHAGVLLLVDVVEHGVACVERVREVRRRTPVPLIVIVGDRDQVAAATYLDAGADDCIARCVRRDELVARIRAVLRRSDAGAATAGQLISLGGLQLDRSTRSVFTDAGPVACTAAEYDILERLARSAGAVVSRDELSLAACGRPASPLDRSVDVHISHLRRKLRRYGRHIVTVRGAGYMLAARTYTSGR